MPLDPTISLEAGKGVTPNLLTGITSDPAKLQNLLTLTGKNAAGEAYQQSINPETGLLDEQAYATRLANDPRARFVTPEAHQQSIEMAARQQKLQQERRNYLMQQTISLLADPDPTKEKYTSTVKRIVNDGAIPAWMGAKELGAMPLTPDGKLDKDKFNIIMTTHLGNTMSAEQQTDFLLGKIVPLNDGDKIHYVQLSPLGTRKIGDMTLQPSPGEQTQPVQRGVDESGIPISTTVGKAAATRPGAGAGPTFVAPGIQPLTQQPAGGSAPRIPLGAQPSSGNIPMAPGATFAPPAAALPGMGGNAGPGAPTEPPSTFPRIPLGQAASGKGSEFYSLPEKERKAFFLKQSPEDKSEILREITRRSGGQ